MKKISFFLVLMLTACSLRTSKSSVLDDSDCELPCWNNILPGTTHQQEAVEIIENLQTVDKSSVMLYKQPWNGFDETSYFVLKANSVFGKNETYGEIYFRNNKVEVLLLKNNLNLSFKDVLQETGSPQKVISMPFDGSNPVVIAIYPTQGIMIEAFPITDDLNQETAIDKIMFFDPGSFDRLSEYAMFSEGVYNAAGTNKIMYPWNGYGNISELYPPRLP